jgi:uncharacterized C2H2 Zn-finger protein
VAILSRELPAEGEVTPEAPAPSAPATPINPLPEMTLEDDCGGSDDNGQSYDERSTGSSSTSSSGDSSDTTSDEGEGVDEEGGEEEVLEIDECVDPNPPVPPEPRAGAAPLDDDDDLDSVDTDPLPPPVEGALLGRLAVRGLDGEVYAEIKGGRSEMYVRCPRCGVVRTRSFIRSALKVRKFQGRPLGYLAAWVLKGLEDEFASAASHKHSDCFPTYEERLHNRMLLAAEPNADDFFGVERRQRKGEGLEPVGFK